jgi:hypothetical protein
MTHKILFFASIFFSLCSDGQVKSTNNIFSEINTVAQAYDILKTHSEVEGKIFFLQSTKDTNGIVLPLFDQKAGFTFKIDVYSYKLLEFDSALSFKVNYIYLSGDAWSKIQIDSLRSEIISKYRNGTPFFELAMQYNMDGNTTGQLDWFQENMMMPEFETAVKSHKKGDIFIVDIPTKQWYHVVLKVEDDTFIKRASVIRIKSSR